MKDEGRCLPRLVVAGHRCVTCLRCVLHCTADALSVDGDTVAVDRGRCVSCGTCIPICRTDALSLIR
ncbi:MAG: ferredoxin [Spirochaetales bacterium]|nr:MAG: ferredoxin [Spirochaetales bacterium]